MCGGKRNWKKKKEKKTDFEDLDSFWDSLNRVGKIYIVRHSKEISETREGVHWGDNDGRMLHK